VVERALLDKMSAVFPMVLRPMPVQVGTRTSGSTVSWLPSLGAWRRPCWFCSASCSVYAMYIAPSQQCKLDLSKQELAKKVIAWPLVRLYPSTLHMCRAKRELAAADRLATPPTSGHPIESPSYQGHLTPISMQESR
jgi:hypothetical protein